ncbi:hypothetical protein GDO86_014274 [Hymenochirus boettgeri]|uniref:Uncharacterized protein n=1 Tax=Hymenochirus boettgeri TaxID=247094 RepID=A0A8T2JSE3_9PIPI|nr:hypothetical protein GDO86_014274 [Hymenochirus boettgeri]
MEDLVDAEEYLVPHKGFFQSEETTAEHRSRISSTRSAAETQADQPLLDDAASTGPTFARSLSQKSGGSGSDAFSEGEYVFESPHSRENSYPRRYIDDLMHTGDDETDSCFIETDSVSPGIQMHLPAEYVNQKEGESSHSPPKSQRPSVSTLERQRSTMERQKSTLERQKSTLERQKSTQDKPKGQYCRNGLVRELRSPPAFSAVDNPDYLPPPGLHLPYSFAQAFDNPYYWNHEFNTANVEGEDSQGQNGFTTPTAENPEYLGLDEMMIRPHDVTA